VGVPLDDERANARMNRSPDREIDTHHPPRLARVRRARDGDFEAVTPSLRSDEASVQQELLEVADEPWSVDEDVQAAWALRSGRNGVASLTVVKKRSTSRHCHRPRRERSEVPPQWTPPRKWEPTLGRDPKRRAAWPTFPQTAGLSLYKVEADA